MPPQAGGHDSTKLRAAHLHLETGFSVSLSTDECTKQKLTENVSEPEFKKILSRKKLIFLMADLASEFVSLKAPS